ncbi:alpha/beta fold hydrolase [Knoellia subterranea]|uniref:Esterase n=1 Tax=Knoellia subterranea KCTC 19937 TaxID=1385521 RepID=A0A0A0JPX3_9MICO|nr:alpha/beta hydrolase [Knoellia subterranea]KGN37646.1 esterase [Knoellia subterranea KCTC 19937]
MHIVLIGGLWLTGSAWDAVVPEITALGHTAVPITLPGQGDGTSDATLDDQVAAVVAAVDEAPDSVVVVGHSGACSLAWLAADARPEKVSSVVFIGGFPEQDGATYADFFEPVDGLMGFPGWAKFEGPDSDDMSDELKTSVEAAMVPVPVGVSRGIVHLKDERRYAVPGVLVCPEFSPEQAREWIDGGDTPELARMEKLELVDIDSGHWPMYTQPQRLAELLVDAAPTP